MKLQFDPKQFKLGMRTFKTGLAVFLVILTFRIFKWEGVQIAALTAVFSLREDMGTSLEFGASRILGNTIGGVCAMLLFLIEMVVGQHFWVTLFFVPLFAMLTIMLNVAMGNKVGVIGAVSAFLIITLSVASGDRLLFALKRVVETFAGVFIAIIVNADVKILKERYLAKLSEGGSDKKK